MLRSQDLFLNVQSTLVAWFSLLMFALGLVEHGQSVQRLGNRRVFGPQHHVDDRQSSLIKCFRMPVLTLVAIEPCQCIEAGRTNGMFRSQYLLANHEGTRKVGDRILIAQDLGLPLPNCTCGLSPHTALTESPTFFRGIGV